MEVWKRSGHRAMGRYPATVPLRRLAALLLAAAVLSLPVTCTGCWDRQELDQIHHAVSLYFDWDAGMLRLTAEVFSESGEETPAAPAGHVIISARGAGLVNAMHNARLSSQRPLNLAHVDFIVFGEELARHGLGELVDALTAFYQVRGHVRVAVTAGSAHELLGAQLTAPRHAEHLLGLLEGAARTGVGGGMSDLLRLQRSLASGGAIDPLLTRLSLLPPPPVAHMLEHAQAGAGADEGAGGAGGGGHGGEAGGAAGAPPLAAIGGAALFQGDRLVGFLEPYEALGLQWAQTRISNLAFWVPHAEGGGFSLLVTDTHPKVTTSETGGRLQVRIDVRVEANVNEIAGPLDAGSPEKLLELEALAAEYIEEQISSGVVYAGRMETDPLGVGMHLKRWLPDVWRRHEAVWPAPLAEAAYDIQATVRIVTTGILNRRAPLGPR